MEDKEKHIRIVAAAIRWRGINFTGVRHGFIIKQIVELGQIENGEHIGDGSQGFICSDGYFRTRPAARELAILAGQVKPDHGTLYSEDLW